MGFALIDTMFLSAKDVNVSKIPMGFFFFFFFFLFFFAPFSATRHAICRLCRCRFGLNK